MRDRHHFAVAVRKGPENVVVWKAKVGRERSRWCSWPGVRGLLAVYDALRVGMVSLSFSADEQLERQGERPLNPLHWVLSAGVALAVWFGLFILLPNLAAEWMRGGLGVTSKTLLNLVEGTIRLAVAVGYIAAVGSWGQIRRVFQYHGAEHSTVACYEAGLPLTLENAAGFSPYHVRCGTNLLGFVLVMKLLLLPLFGWGGIGRNLAVRLLVTAALVVLGFELLKAAGKNPRHPLLRAAIAPGMWLQRLTARRPEAEQIQVAIYALEALQPVPVTAVGKAK